MLHLGILAYTHLNSKFLLFAVSVGPHPAPEWVEDPADSDRARGTGEAQDGGLRDGEDVVPAHNGQGHSAHEEDCGEDEAES